MYCVKGEGKAHKKMLRGEGTGQYPEQTHQLSDPGTVSQAPGVGEAPGAEAASPGEKRRTESLALPRLSFLGSLSEPTSSYISTTDLCITFPGTAWQFVERNDFVCPRVTGTVELSGGTDFWRTRTANTLPGPSGPDAWPPTSALLLHHLEPWAGTHGPPSSGLPTFPLEKAHAAPR